MKPFIPKDDNEIPDFYIAKVWFFGSKEPLELKLAGHRIIDKVFNPVQNENGVVYELAGTHSAPYFEYDSYDDEIGIVPMSSIQRIEFGKDFSKIKELSKKEKK